MRNSLITHSLGVPTTLFIFAILPSFAHAGIKADKPNIILIVADDLGWRDVGYHGSEIKTPVLDKLAKESIQLDRFYVYPTCSPTRACLLTGRNAARFGIHGPIGIDGGRIHLPLCVKTLPKLLKERGYATALVGKWHLGATNDFGPRKHGFDYFYGYLHGQVDQFNHESWDLDPIWQRNEEPIKEEGHATDLFARESVAFIKKSKDKPFFLNLCFSVPHYPVQAPDSWVEKYEKTIEDKERRIYAAMVSQMDDAIGRVLAVLDEAKVRENTLVLFTSDNGGQKDWNSTDRYGGKHGPYKKLGDNAPLRGWKTELYEGGVRVVAMAHWRGKLEVGVFQGIGHACDFMPTIAGLTGEPASASLKLDGIDLWPELTGKARSKLRSFHWNIGSQAGILSGNGKYITFAGKHPHEMYELDGDPYEVKNRLENFQKEDILALLDLRSKLIEELKKDLEGIREWNQKSSEKPNYRTPKSEADLRYWLQNMMWHHRFTIEEIAAATGLDGDRVLAALKKWDIRPETKPNRPADSPLLVLPYPGGRHPRIGFLDGAIKPQRETKISAFTPWDDKSYVVVDVPEAIWSNLGLTYLAHTHIDTVWTKQKIDLEPLEWNRHDDGSLDIERKLPNGVVFGAKVLPKKTEVRMEMWLKNGTKEKLSDLRVQNCVMLKGAASFQAQTNDNKVISSPYVACKSEDGKRWIITAWEPCNRAWANPPCPCLHSDPKFPDCAPGETKRLKGWLSFYEGKDIEGEIRRIDQTGWRTEKEEKKVRLRGEVRDADTGKLIGCRLYLQDAKGVWHFPRSEGGSAIPYKKQRSEKPQCVEMHTTLSAHPFIVDTPPGKYTVTIEHGKEYLPFIEEITIAEEPVNLQFDLKRWINLAERGWYAGETHVHRPMEELPTLVLAEDLNVTFPLTYWVTDAFASPKNSPRAPLKNLDPRPIPVDATHVIYPRNTEYELFRVNKQAHMLGAFFVLNHQSVLDEGVPPVKALAERVHKEGALIELDKHNWPWSMAIVPIMKVDLFELANNHVWRTEFGFPGWAEPAGDYMKTERTKEGFTEWGWIDYGFQNYYALLNCGFRLRPTAGTGSGVHPVPLGFGRVYVHLPDGFSYEKWLKGLNEGRSFVTTGPMLFVKVNGQEGGHTFKQTGIDLLEYRIDGAALSSRPLQRIEMIVNGEVARTLKPANKKADKGGYESPIDEKIKIDTSSWLAVRCFEDHHDKRIRFAHSSPVHIDVAGKPLRPRKEEVEWLIKRVEDQITRSGSVIPEPALVEYKEALRIYKQVAKDAR